MKEYFFDRKTAFSDLIVGINLGIASIPVEMASWILAAVNLIHGVYAYMVGSFTLIRNLDKSHEKNIESKCRK